MANWKNSSLHIPPRAKLAGGAVALLVLGAAAGASAVSHMRPSVEMAPAMPTAIAKVPQASGVVTVKGKIVEVYGDRFIMQDGSGRLLIDVGPDGSGQLRTGNALMVQGRYDNGQLRASYLVDSQGRIADVGASPHPPRGPGHDGPPPSPPPPSGAAVPPAPSAPSPVDANGAPENSRAANAPFPGAGSAIKR